MRKGIGFIGNMSSSSGEVAARDGAGEAGCDQGGTPNEGAGEVKASKTDRRDDCGSVGVLGDAARRGIGHGVLGAWWSTLPKI